MNVRITTSTLVAALVAALVAVIALVASPADALPRVHPGVHRALHKQGTVNLIVTLASTTESTLSSVKEATFETRSAKIQSLKDKLQAHTKSSAAEVETLLNQESSTGGDTLHTGYKSFWISNQMSISAASFELVEKLAGLESIASIAEEGIRKINRPHQLTSLNEVETSTRALLPQQTSDYPWGISKVGAPHAWAEGITGQGIVVAHIDGGVRGTHEALKNNFRGAYGWYDPQIQAAAPYDTDGHGSHTMGTIAGSKGIGVAPGAKWMTCKGCRGAGCYDAELLACAQFILCPTDTQGNNADCSKAPHVVGNSWSSPGGDYWYQAVVDAWVAAGIIPVFSLGNEGACDTANSPGDYANAIGVGASMPLDGIAPYSSLGPTVDGRVKPDITAPGFAVLSADGSGDSAYVERYGTSQAAPHVAGTIALMLSAQPSLTFDQVKRILFRTADRKGLTPTNLTCGGTADSNWPNNQWGNGRLNAYNTALNLYPDPEVRPHASGRGLRALVL